MRVGEKCSIVTSIDVDIRHRKVPLPMLYQSRFVGDRYRSTNRDSSVIDIGQPIATRQ